MPSAPYIVEAGQRCETGAMIWIVKEWVAPAKREFRDEARRPVDRGHLPAVFEDREAAEDYKAVLLRQGYGGQGGEA